MASWCHVKFVGDGQTVNVRTSYIEAIAEKKLTREELRKNTIYWVFWSAISDETPQSIMKKGNKIIKIDDLAEKEKERRMKSNGGPLKGYYKAMLLDLKNSEDSFHNLSSSTTTSSKRVVIPSSKVVEAAEAHSSKGSANSTSVAKPSKRQLTDAAAEANRKNIRDLLESCGSGLSQKVEDNSQDSFEDSENEDTCEDSNSAEYWKRKFNKMKAKKDKSKNKKPIKKSKKTLKKNADNLSESEMESKASKKLKEPAEMPPVVQHEDSNASSPEPKDNEYTPSEEEKDEQKKEASKINSQQTTDSEDEDDCDDDSFNLIKKRKTKSGQAGDSLFVMNEALKIWGHEKVAIRCPTGLAQLRKGSFDKVAYPKMTPEKVKEVSDKLKKRIQREGAGKKELKRRTAKLQYYLGQRVTSSRRALRNKGVKIPSPEEVLAVRKDDPASDGTAAYRKESPRGSDKEDDESR